MATSRFLISAIALGALIVAAAPIASSLGQQSIIALTPSQIESFTPYSHYASAGYCQPSDTLAWSCGENCDATFEFLPMASGGDGSATQFWYVGYDPVLSAVVVSHQGTDPTRIEALFTDGDFFLRNLDSTLFPGLSSSIKAHAGFAHEHAKTAALVLSAVKAAMSKYSAMYVAVVGHSLGAAIAVLDSIYLRLRLPSGTVIKTIGYGLPRVGNKAFADYVDAHLSLTHINNMDFVPILPGEFFGYVHPSGEVHIQDSGAWLACPGQDNPSSKCIVGDVPTIFQGRESNHGGPYNGVEMGC